MNDRPTFAPLESPFAAPPLARRAVLPLTLVVVALAGQAVIAPLLILATGSRRHLAATAWQYFREGGWSMWAITLAQVMLAPMLAVLGAFVVRGKRLAGPIAFVLSLGPFTIGLLGALVGQRKLENAVDGALIDASYRGRVVAMGASELANVFIYGAAASGFAMYTVGVAAILGVVAIDRAPLGDPPPSFAWMLPIPVGILAAVAAGVVRGALGVQPFALDALVIVGIVACGGLAALASRPLPALIARRNDRDAGAVWRLLLLAAFAFAAAMVLVDRATLAAALREPLGATSGYSVWASQKLHILLQVVPDYRGRPIVMIVDGLACLVTFAAPLAAGLRAQGKLSFAGAAAALAAILVGLLGALTGARVERGFVAQKDAIAREERLLRDRGITLPVVTQREHMTPPEGPPELFIARDGVVRHGASPTGSSATVHVAADGAVPFGVFVTNVAPHLRVETRTRGSSGPPLQGRHLQLNLAVSPRTPLDTTPLGPLAGFVGSQTVLVHAQVARSIAEALRAPSYDVYDYGLGILVEGDTGRLVLMPRGNPAGGVRLSATFPLDDGASPEKERIRVFERILRADHRNIGWILVAPAPHDTIASVLALLDGIDRALDGARVMPSPERLLITDRTTLERAEASSREAQ